MDYITRKKTHHVVACLCDGTKKVIYSYLEKMNINTWTFTSGYTKSETNYGFCRYTNEVYNDYEDYDGDNEMVERKSPSYEYLKPLRLVDFYSLFIESESEEDEEKDDIMTLLLKNDIELEDLDSLIVYVAFEETDGYETKKHYTDFIVDKKSAEEWEKFSDTKRKDLEDDFFYFIFD